MSKNIKKWASHFAVLLCVTVVILCSVIYFGFRASLPILEGVVQTAVIKENVTVERDKDGNATITANSRADLSYVTGYVHAQERFFQMDLSRRMAAGELSELFGVVAMGSDRTKRLHRFRARAHAAVEALPAADKLLLINYVDGVNAGLNDLGSKPFEYWLLGASPKLWSAEDTILVIYSMFFTLQDEGGGYEWQNHLIKQSLSPELASFLLPARTEWDAPIEPDATPFMLPEIPSAPAINHNLSASLVRDDQPMLGSNNWAVSGAITKSGAAMLSNDMHLSIRAPSIWYKLRLKLADGSLDITGVSLPGGPMIIAGSNGSVAWGFTNSNIDTSDIIKLKINPDFENQYLTADGYRDFNIFDETIIAKDGTNEVLKVKETIWGPVIDFNDEETYVFHWVAHQPEAVNMGLLRMEKVTSVKDTQAQAEFMGMPAQNAMLADKDGNIGWTIFGKVPRRGEADYNQVMDWSDGRDQWDGWYTSAEYPKVYNPENNRLWTANGRVVSGDDLKRLGINGYDLGARAKQIRDDLFKLTDNVIEQDLYNIMLDNEAVLLSRWQQQLVSVLKESSEETFAPFLKEIENWGGKADINSIGFRLVRDYRNKTYETLMGYITAACPQYNSQCNYDRATNHWESPLWQLVSERPDGWLPPSYGNWSFFFEKMAIEAWQPILKSDVKLVDYTWGARNFSTIKHPLSNAVPFLGKLTDMQGAPQNGDTENMPHIAGNIKGQSERIVVSPGHEDTGVMNLPAGQSGHPLSPYFGNGHEDWLKGNITPFLPQDTKWTLQFMPSG